MKALKVIEKTIIIDHRERADELKQHLSQAGFYIEEQQLKCGDYSIFPDTLVERKTTRDFCLSIVDGRLFQQACNLKPARSSLLKEPATSKAIISRSNCIR